MIKGSSTLYGIIGYPITHSLSPAMHNAAFQALGIEAVYIPLAFSPQDFAKGIEALATLNVMGFNVTIPYKKDIMPHLNRLTKAAQETQAVNTVRHSVSGWEGTNTDRDGFIRALKEDLGENLSQKRVLLIGAGGSAWAIISGLLAENVAKIVIANRNYQRGQLMVDHFMKLNKAATKLEQVEYPLQSPLEVDILINATSVGMDGVSMPVEFGNKAVTVTESVIDIIYAPPQTPLLAQAENLGLKTQNGLKMLLLQGVCAFEFWTGHAPPIEIMRGALLANK